jgi:hypothetical protein
MRMKKKPASTTKLEPVVEQLHELGNQLSEHLKKAHVAFHRFDAKKQKKILAGIAGTIALLAGVHAMKNHAKNKKKVM